MTQTTASETTAAPEDAGRVHRIRRFFAWFGRGQGSAEDGEPDPNVFRFETPGMGDAFDFDVAARCEWQAWAGRSRTWERLDGDDIADDLVHARRIVRLTVEDTAREVLRRVPPHRPADAERALAHALRGDFDFPGLRCHVVVCVTAVDEIRGQLREHWTDLMAFELQSERSDRLAGELGHQRRTWQAFLAGGLAASPGADGRDEAWLFQYALSLAEDPSSIATAFRELTEQRRRDAEELSESLSEALAQSRELDVLEFLLRTDSALRRTMEVLGVALPPLSDESPLHDAAAPAVPPA